MARVFLTPLDLAKNELQNARIQNLGSAPSSPVKGQVYFNSGDNTMYYWDGGAWQSAKGGTVTFPGFGVITAETTFGAAKNDGAGTTSARNDHQHGNPTHDNAAHSAITLASLASPFGAVTAQTAFGAASNNGVGTSASRNDHVHGTPTHDNAAHSAITLNSLAAPTAFVNLNLQKITNLADPTNVGDAANKQYVDAVAQGYDPKPSVRAMNLTGNVVLSGVKNLDSVTLQAGDRVLIAGQTLPAENGIYIMAAGAWSRAPDMDAWTEVPGASVFVEEGGAYADTAWVCTSNQGGTLGTTAITWTQTFGPGAYLGGAGLTLTGNTFDVGQGSGILVNPNDVAVNWGGTGAAATVSRSDHNHDTAYPPLARQIATTAPLTGGGDLSANRTLAISNFAGSAPGAVPTSPGGTVNFLRADGTWASPTSGIATAKFSASVGGATSAVVTHNLNSRDVQVQVYRSTSPYDTVECDVERTDANNVTLRFAIAPASNEFRCVVIG